MAFFKIATIGDTKDNMLFEVAQQLLAQNFSENDINQIEFVDITGMAEEDILLEGTIHGVMYFTDVHNDPNKANALKILLNSQTSPSDLKLFALSHEPVTYEEQASEQKNIESYISQEEFPDTEILVSPANITTEKEMEAYTNGIIKTSLIPYFEFVGSIESQTQQKVESILSFVNSSLEFKHPYTAGHVQRVSTFAEAIAKEMGCTEKEVQDIVIASALHDIGKLIIPDKILASPEKLSDFETKQMEIHDKAGAQFLESIANYDDELSEKLSPEVLKGIKYHHKHWDGMHDKHAKEPDPINHEKIGKYATIIAVADCIDAMTSQRAYNNPKHILDTFRDLWANREKQFEPQAAEAAILLLAKEIASLGYDPVQMFSEVSDSPWKVKIDEGLQSFFLDNADKFEVNRNPDPKAFSRLGFRLDENGYFEFEGKNSTRLNPEIRLKNEIEFLISHPEKIQSISEGIELPKSELEKAAKIQALKKFQDQDLEGKLAIERAIHHEHKRDIPNEILEFSQNDKEFNVNNYNNATTPIRNNFRNPEVQKESGIDNIINNSVTTLNDNGLGDR